MKELIRRLTAKTPVFFKKTRSISLAIAGACSAAVLFYSQLPQGVMDLVSPSFMKGLAIGGGFAAFVAQLAKEDK